MSKYTAFGLCVWAMGIFLGFALELPILFWVGWALQVVCSIVGLAVEDIKNATR